MMRRIGMIAAVLVLGASSARGETVSYAFAAEDATGRTISGRFSYDTDIRPQGAFPGTQGGGGDFGAADDRIVALVEFEGREYLILPSQRRGAGFHEITLYDGVVGGDEPDAFYLQMPEGVVNNYPNPFPTLHLTLIDEDWTAFDTHLSLPRTLDLADFERKEVFFTFGSGFPSIRATITSLTPSAPVVPEPSTLALCGIAAGGIALAVRRRRAA